MVHHRRFWGKSAITLCLSRIRAARFARYLLLLEDRQGDLGPLAVLDDHFLELGVLLGRGEQLPREAIVVVLGRRVPGRGTRRTAKA